MLIGERVQTPHSKQWSWESESESETAWAEEVWARSRIVRSH